MRTHIDWLTFTFTPLYPSGIGDNYTQALADGLREMFGMKLWVDVFDGEWGQHGKGRAPYEDKWHLGEQGISLYASPSLAHACVEISGQGCEKLISSGYMEQLLMACHNRTTRIDIASDIETITTPSTFVEHLSHERMRSSGYQKSATGETCYVGSKKSDRYARIYRYAEPHPRARFLRVECVFRRDYAKSVARACVQAGIGRVAQACGDAFGFNHVDWRPHDGASVDISVVKAEKNGGGTIFWLVKQAAPAFRRMVEEGIINNPEQFLQHYFLSDN